MDEKNVINQNNVKPTLKSREKSRFQQIGENFFKGSHAFMREFHNNIIKGVDEKIIKSNFVQEYQENLKQYQNSLVNQIDDAKEEQAKNSLWNKILNFIIICEVGVIALSAMPFNLTQAKQFGSRVLETIEPYLEQVWNKIDFRGLWDGMIGGLNEAFTPIWEYMLEVFYEWLNSDNNVFTKCFLALARTAVKRGKGPGQWIMNMILSYLADETLKRPSIMHWLLYGNKVFTKVNDMEQAQFDLIMQANDTSTGWFDASNAEIGVFRMGDEQMEWYGVDAGKARMGGSMELENVRSSMVNHMERVQNAAKQISQEERVQHMYGTPNMLSTAAYQDMLKNWNELQNKTVDIAWASNVKYSQLKFNFVSAKRDANGRVIKTDPPENIKKIREAYDKLIIFKEKYANSTNPFAKQICAEFQARLGNVGVWDFESVPVAVMMFVPALYYAVLQFEYIQERNEKIVSSMSRVINTMGADVREYERTRETRQFDQKTEDTRAGRLSISQYVTYFKDFLTKFNTNPNPILTGYSPSLNLTFKHVMYDTFNVIINGLKKIKSIFDNDERYRALQTIEITERDGKQYQGEIYIGNEREVIQDAIRSDITVKANIREQYQRRLQLMTIIDNNMRAMTPAERRAEQQRQWRRRQRHRNEAWQAQQRSRGDEAELIWMNV